MVQSYEVLPQGTTERKRFGKEQSRTLLHKGLRQQAKGTLDPKGGE